MNKILSIYFFCFETGSLVTQADLELVVFLPPPLKHWDYRYAPPRPPLVYILMGYILINLTNVNISIPRPAKVKYSMSLTGSCVEGQSPTGLLFWVVVELGEFKGMHLKDIYLLPGHCISALPRA